MIKVWSLAKELIPLHKRKKLGPTIINCLFISFANAKTAYKFLVYKSKVHEIHVNIILESSDVELFENIFPYKKKLNEFIK